MLKKNPNNALPLQPFDLRVVIRSNLIITFILIVTKLARHQLYSIISEVQKLFFIQQTLMAIKKVLLLGSSFSAIPILNVLKNLGFHVTVCGVYKDDPCHFIGDSSIYIDYSTIPLLDEHLTSEHYSYIVPSCNDTAYRAGAALAEKFNFPGFDTLPVVNILHTKQLLRKFLGANNFPSPKSYSIEEAIHLVSASHPLIVKPVDSFSGKGVSIVKSKQELASQITAATEISDTNEVVIEDFCNGQLVSHSAFVSSGQIVDEFFVDEYCTVYPYQVNCSCHPSSLIPRFKDEISLSISRLIRSLQLQNGLLHTQLICNNDQWVIIECMRRAPGDLYGHLIYSSLDYPYWEQYVRPFLDLSLLDWNQCNSPRFIARHTVSSPTSVMPCSFRLQSTFDNIEVYQLHTSGAPLKPAPFDKMAILFCEYSSCDQLWSQTPNFGELTFLTPPP
jgi:predicted ATP-grasp superfamily ATP-dependent carboligase